MPKDPVAVNEGCGMKNVTPTLLIVCISVLFAALVCGVFIGRQMNRRFLYADEVGAIAGEKSLDINTASAAEFAALEGVSEALAERIVTHRARWGTFTSVDQLLNVDGFTQDLLELLRDRLTVD